MKRFNITVNGSAYDVTVEEISGSAPAAAPAAPVAAAPAAPAAPAAAPAASGGEPVKCPMPGTIVDVKVNVGDAVAEGQIVVILEAMKMENEIVAPHAGKIASIAVKKGDSVNADDVLVTLA